MELVIYFLCVVIATFISVWIDESLFPNGYFANPFKTKTRILADESRKIKFDKFEQKAKSTRK